MGILGNITGALFPRWGGGGWGWDRTYLLAPGSRYDYGSEAGDIWANSIVALGIKWLGDRFPRPKVSVSKILADGTYKPISNHPAAKLWDRPNPYYSRRALEKAIGLSLICDGNAYIQKVRDGRGQVAELWWLPHFTVFPMWNGDEFISSYRIVIDGLEQQILDKADCIHIRDGIDPSNVRLGLSATKSQIREICTINEESGYTAAIMRNAGVTGLVIIPSDPALRPKEKDAEAIKRSVKDATTGENRGSTIVLGGRYEVKSVGFSPEQLMLKDLPLPAISRIASSLGVAPMSLGLPDPGKTYSNLGEANKTSWGTVKSIQELVGESLRYELLPEFGLDPDAYCVEYDYSEIDELQESEDAVWNRVFMIAWKNGGITLNEARDLVGLPPDPDGDRFYPGTGSTDQQPEVPGISVLNPTVMAGTNGTATNRRY